MQERGSPNGAEDLDGLRLLALSRIARCSACERYRALAGVYRGAGAATALPPVPLACDHQICAPLVSRLVRSIA